MLFKRKTAVYSIEINDEKINNQITSLIIDLEKNIDSLNKTIEENRFTDKDKTCEEIYNLFIKLNEKTDELLLDVNKISNIELQEKEFIKINDDKFLKDKLDQLSAIKENINLLIGEMENRPSAEELKSELLATLTEKVCGVVAALTKLREDDEKLQALYEKITQI